MNKNSKIGIIGGYGFHNWGDDAQLYNNLRLLKTQGYNNLSVMSPNEYIKDLFEVNITDSFHSMFPIDKIHDYKFLMDELIKIYYILQDYPTRKIFLTIQENKLINFIKSIDVLFFSGSGTINTRGMYGLYVMLFPCLIAKIFKKKVILSGQGFLPLNNYKLEPFINYVLNQVDYIVTRDFKLGKTALDKIGIKIPKIVCGVDDAFTTPRENINNITILPKSIAINVSHFIKPKMIQILYSFAKKLKAEGYNPIFNYFQDDRDIAEKCSKGEFQIQNFTHPCEIAYFYSQVIGSIGMRYHSAIFGLAGENPTINIYTNEYQYLKIKAIQEETKIPDFMINYSEITVESLYELFKKALTTQPNHLKIINKNWRNRANLAINLLKKL